MCAKRYTTGHSLGGASIEFMTICLSPLKDIELDGFFSFGAPGISEEPIPVDRELTMPTYRVWMNDRTGEKFDMVPWILEGLHGLGHPKMTSIEMDFTGNRFTGNGTYLKHVMSADEPGATEAPTGSMGMPSMTLHMIYDSGAKFIYGE